MDISNKTITALVAIALIITILGTVTSITRIDAMGYLSGGVTGAVTEGTGTASISVSGTTALVVNASQITIYSGYYPILCISGFSRIDTDAKEDDNPKATSCWVNQSGVDNQSRNKGAHRIANNGTTVIQVKAAITSSSTSGVTTLNATSILCGPANCPHRGDNAKIRIKAINDESSSCTQALQNTYTDLADPSSTTNVTLCNRLEYDDANDELNTTFIMHVPKDADQGNKGFTVTYYATAQ